MTGCIGIALGDITGIGPEVALKALTQEMETDDARYLLIGDEDSLRRLNEQLRLRLPLHALREQEQKGRIYIHSPLPEPLPDVLAPGSPTAALAAINWLA